MKLKTSTAALVLSTCLAHAGSQAQVAPSPAPAAPATAAAAAPVTYPTATHRVKAENKQANGWHLAKSTDGRFSVEMPGPFTDTTATKNVSLHLLLSTDTAGATYMAMMERKTDKSMHAKFKADLLAAGPAATTFRGFPALIEELPMSGDNTASSLRFATPAGLYVLSIISPLKDQPQRLGQRDRYFNSLIIE